MNLETVIVRHNVLGTCLTLIARSKPSVHIKVSFQIIQANVISASSNNDVNWSKLNLGHITLLIG